MNEDDLFAEMMANTMLYGMGVLIMRNTEDGKLGISVVPIEEYTELGEHLKWVDQNTKAAR